MPNPRTAARWPAFWRVADRLQLLLYRNGWPARLARRLGLNARIRVVKHAIALRGDARNTPTLTVAFASDFHAGLTSDPDLLRLACNALQAAEPDVLSLGGDFVSLDARQADWLAPLLGAIPVSMGRFAVLENHDRT